MPRNGSGTYQLPSGNPVVPNTLISSSGWANPTLTDLAAAITASLCVDGQTLPTANLPMGNYRHTGVANAQSRTDYAAAGQVQDNSLCVLTSIGGTGDAITATLAPAPTSLATDSKYIYTPTATNTTATPTLSINGLTAVTIVESSGVALVPGALQVGAPYELLYDGTDLRVQTGALANQSTSTQQSISAATASGALTLTYAGGSLAFRNPTQATGTPVSSAVGALSVQIPSGATLGTVNGVNAILVLAIAYNGGAPVAMVAKKTPLLDVSETGLVSPATISTGALSEGVWYSASAVSANSSYRVVGIAFTNEATAGTWVTVPYELQGIGGLAFISILQSWQPQMQTVNSTVASNALTITYTPNGPLQFRNGTLANGAPVVAAMASGPLSIIFPQGATLGAAASQPLGIAVIVAYNGGSPVLCAVNLASGIQLDGGNLISPTTVSAAATAANVIYSAAAVSANSPYVVVGIIQMPGQTTAGNWAAGQTFAQGSAPFNELAMGVQGLINNTNATSDIALAGGQGCYVDINAATTLAWHVATGDNQVYEFTYIATGNGNASASCQLNPNNTTYTSCFKMDVIDQSAASVGSITAYTNGLTVAYQVDPRMIRSIVSTKTAAKNVTSLAIGLISGSQTVQSFVTSTWVTANTITPDTTTPWNSMGSLVFPVASTGRGILRRIA